MRSYCWNESGFSLLGMLMVMLAMGMFTAMVMVTVAPAEATRQLEVTYQRGDALTAALKKFREHNAAVPATLSGLVTSTGPACGVDTNETSATYKKLQGWCGPYIDRPVAGAATEYTTDGWGTTFQYTTTILRSCGPDRTCGNTDDVTFTGY